jgi:predicted dehydrogenase
MSRQPYRAAIVGLGSIARAHLRGYRHPQNAGRVEVIAGADVSAEARGRFASEAGIEPRHTYAAFDELLQRERPDVVSICTWPPLHPELTEAAAGAGVKAVLTEKPMAVDLPGCDRMLAACEGAGALLVVGHQRRLTPKFSRARALLDEGAIGTPLQLTGIAGGDLLTDGTHTVDALRFFAADAPVRWVIGNIDPRPRVLPPLQPGDPPRRSGFQEWDEKGTRYGHPIEQGAFALLAFDGDLRATLETGVCARPGYQRFRIDGSEGAIALSGDRPAEGEPRLRVRRRGSAGWEVLDEELPDLDGFTQEISLLLDALDHGTPHPLAGRSARQTQEVLMAIFESSRRPGRVDLPLP